MALLFILSLIYLYYFRYTSFIILDLAYISNDFYVLNQIRFRYIYLLGLGTISLSTRRFLLF